MSAPSERDKGTAAHEVLQRCLVSIYQWGLSMRAADHRDIVYQVIDEPHEALSPSGAKQWMNCAASPGMQAKHPEPAEAEAVRSVSVDLDYLNAVQMALDYVADRVAALKERYHGAVLIYSELPVRPMLNDERFNGTLDIALAVHGPNGALVFVEIIDFKAGAAVQVEPEDPQLDMYLLGILNYLGAGLHAGDEHLPDSARLTVVQPRNFRRPEKIRWRDIPDPGNWKFGVLAGILDRVNKARLEIDEHPDRFSPSPETCYGCSAKGVCTASYVHSFGQTGVLSEGARLPEKSDDMYAMLQEGAVRDTRSLSGEQLRAVLDARDMLKGALQAAEAWALDQLQKGTAPPEVTKHYKLVRGRSSLKWSKDEEEVLKRLRRLKVRGPNDEKPRALGKKDLVEPKLRSAPKIRDLLKSYGIPEDDVRWAAFNAVSEKPDGGLAIAPQSDPRDEVKPLRKSPDEVFDPAKAPPAGGAEQKT